MLPLTYEAYVWVPKIDWLGLTPTFLLMASQDAQWSRGNLELLKRAKNGDLTPRQTEVLFGRILPIQPVLPPREFYPAGHELPIRIRCRASMRACGADPRWRGQMTFDRVGVTVDGHAGRRAATYHIETFDDGFVEYIYLAPLPPGDHEISVYGSMCISHVWSGQTAACRNLALSFGVCVEPKPLDAFVCSVWDPHAADAVRHRVQLSCDVGADERTFVEVRLTSPPVPVCGRLSYRPAGTSAPYSDTGVRLVARSGDVLARRLPQALPATTVIDVRISPEPEFALAEGLTEYFAGVIEWQNVSLQRALLAHRPVDLLPSAVYPVAPAKSHNAAGPQSRPS